LAQAFLLSPGGPRGLQAGRQAMATPDIELRFAIGTRVQCRTGQGEDGWSLGTVVKHWYRENRWPRDRVAPYQVKLDDGRLIFAPLDEDRVVREPTGLLKDGKIPVTVLTGFLGAGKTTLLNYILKANHGLKYAIIENEVGAVGIDNKLLATDGYDQKSEESITLLDNGCLCCTVRDDLVKAIKSIVEAAKKKEKEAGTSTKALDGILIETTGIADPGPICKTFYGDTFVNSYCKIDGVLTVVDSVHFIEQLTRERTEGAVNESAQQIAFADKVLLNKIDLAGVEKQQQTMEAIRSVNEFVPVTKCSLAKSPEAIPLKNLLSIDAFDLAKMMEGSDVDLSKCGEVDEAHEESGHGGGHGHEEGHGDGHGHGQDCSDDCEHESHGHGGGHGGAHNGGGHGHGHGHAGFRHDTQIGSFVCELVGPMSEEKFHKFLQGLLEKSDDLYRFKGFLAIKSHCGQGKVAKRVIQGVHDVVDMDDGGEWPADSEMKSQMVFIGRNLDKKKVMEQFAKLTA